MSAINNYFLTMTHLIVEARVRYWEDAIVNGIEDAHGDKIPCRRGDCWSPVIKLNTGEVLDWPTGVTADIHYKVCDGGEYFLGCDKLRKWFKYKDYYVPDFMSIGENGYGDYIILTVDITGKIENWKRPEIYENEWEALKI